MEKIVLLFGSFNPITKAHVDNAKSAMKLVGAEKCILIPTSQEYVFSKVVKAKGAMCLSLEDRLSMIEAVCKENEGFSMDRYECKEKGSSTHTYLTIEYIAKKNPGAELYYTCGADKVKSLRRWNHVEKIFDYLKIIVFERDGIDAKASIEEHLKAHEDSFILTGSLGDTEDISSTKVRSLFLKDDMSYLELVPKGVGQILSKYSKKDFPEMNTSSWVKLMHKYGGMHGPETALKEIYEKNKSILSEKTIGETIFEESPKASIKPVHSTKIEKTEKDCTEILAKLSGKDNKIGIISVCNMAKTCGGYADGLYKDRLDEEELCRISSLSAYLYPYGNPKLKAIKECGFPPVTNQYPLSHDSVIYCKDVEFFRSTKQNWYMESDSYKADVLLIPALSNRFKDSSKLLLEDLKYFEDGRLTKEGMDILQNSIRNVFSSAINHSLDTLILGDFGIRSYHLAEGDLKEALATVLKEFDGCFKRIILSLTVSRTNKYELLYSL